MKVLTTRSPREFTENLLDQALGAAQLSPPDRGLCVELVYGVVRWQATLDWLVARKTPGRTQKPVLQNLLRLGLYQLFWLDRIPDHAAVNETVNLSRQSGFGPQSGFVNALLRGYLREKDETRTRLTGLKADQPAVGYSHPEWLVEKWERRWGKESVGRLLESNNVPPKTFARVNTLKGDAGKLLEMWREENVEYDFVREPWLPENLVFHIKSHPPLPKMPSFQQGWFYIQDPSTLVSVSELAPRAGQVMLDLCAAPGGKLTYMAQVMGNEGRIFAHDSNTERMKLVEQNLARLGVSCVEIAQQVGKAQVVALQPKRLPGTVSVFDGILIDAPCSNTGVMRRRVDLRWRVSPNELETLTRVQLGLLETAAAFLAPTGTLVYSTCSLEAEENQDLVRRFLGQNPGWKLEGERELLPFKDGYDGAYVAKLTRSGSTPSR